MNFDFSKEPGAATYNRDLVTTEAPLLSVVTPYYNAKRYFQFLYPCVLNQTFPWFEWIIVECKTAHSPAGPFCAGTPGPRRVCP